MEIQSHDFTLRPIDTLAISKRLRASGYTEAQAEVQAEIWAEIIERNLASKRDLKELEVSFITKMRDLEISLLTKMESLRKDTEINTESLRKDTEINTQSLRKDMEAMRIELKRDIRESEQRLTIKLGGMLVVGISVISALMKLL